MKKEMIIVMIFIMLSITGCGTNNSETSMNREWSSSIDKADAFGAAICKDKMIYIENDQLWIMNLKNKEKTIFCSRANCDHNSECCEAVPPVNCNSFSAVVLHGNDVFEFCSTDEINQTVVYKKQIGDSGREKYATIPCDLGASYSDLYAKDKYIFFVADNQVVDSTGNITGYKCQIVKLNLDTKQLEEVSPIYEHPESVSISKLCYSEKALLYCVTRLSEGVSTNDVIAAQGKQDYKKLDKMFKNEYFLLDLNKSEPENLDSDKNYIGFCNDNLIYSQDDKIMMNSEENSAQVLCEENKKEITNAFCSDKGIYYEVSDDDQEIGRYYSFDEKKLYSIKEQYATTPIMISSEYVVLYMNDQNDQFCIQAVNLNDYVKDVMK